MKVLVTGSEGFVGGHLTRALAEAGHEVSRADLKREPLLEDCRRPENLRRLLAEHRPDAVVHLAARVGRLFGEDDLAETIADNAAMTATVARACGEAGIRLAYASTSEVYGDCGDLVAVEDPPGGPGCVLAGRFLPHNAYGLSKRWGEDACRLYAPDGLAILRLSMPYGPGLPHGTGRAALVNFLWAAMEGKPLTVHRGAERSWCWIGDAARAIRTVLEADRRLGLRFGDAWNVGRDDNAISMLTVAEMARDLVGSRSPIVEVDPPIRQTVVKRLSTEKLRAIGWRPTVDLAEGMARTLAALRAERDGS